MKKKKLVDLSIGIRKYILPQEKTSERTKRRGKAAENFMLRLPTTIMHYSL